MGLPCPACNSESSLEFSQAEADLYRCPNCDHCFSDVNSIQNAEQYDADYYELTHRNWFNNPNTKLFAAINEFVKHDASVLDLGCGNGDFLKYLLKRNKGLSLYGVDLSSCPPVDGIDYVQGDALAIEFRRTFDVVTNLAVIEHVVDVKAFTARLSELCNAGGLVVIMTLNDRSILYGLARLLNRFGYKVPFERLYSKHHVNHFNESSLRRLVEANGLSVVSVLRHNVPLAAVDFDASTPLLSTVLKAGVFGTFILGRLTARTYLQTVVCRKT